MNRRWVGLVGVAAVVASTLSLGIVAPAVAAPCDPGGNPIVCENSKPGTPESDWGWQVDGAGDPTLQGFGTKMSINVGERIDFKIKSTASSYKVEIFRLGYYQGDGARRIATVTPSASLPQTQPTCLSDASTQLYDCGNWAVSASWTAPSTAVSGVYVALLTRPDTDGQSHIPFVVRDDSSHSDLVYQTSDTTWQAYNNYGGASFYGGNAPVGRAYKLSYNRPFNTRSNAGGRDYLFANEFAMIRFIERNGYDVSYISGIDTDRSGALLKNHKAFASVGHDEYWSGQQRANVEAARDAGVNLAFFSGNEMYWRTRWEPSIDGTSTSYRTLVSYKETWSNAKIDPSPEWTGTWRDPRFSPPSQGGGLPENGTTGTAYMSNDTDLPIQVPAAQGKTRFWRNTSVATLPAGGQATLADHTVGYESNEDLDNGSRPAGLIRLSTTTGPAPSYLVDFGNTIVESTTTHHLTQYRAPSGALVFSAGTIQYAFGLDDRHDGPVSPPDVRLQQATVNLFADMGSQPDTLMSGLVVASASADHTGPTVTITSPSAGATLPNGSSVTVSGTATDTGGGIVAGIEVSTDGGTTWHPGTGTSSWSYTYTQKGVGPTASIMARATDDSSNIGAATSRSVATSCPCSLYGVTPPNNIDAGADSPVNLGVKFVPDTNGFILGVRFYKSAANTGTHTGALWSPSGTLMASGTFTNETASGWQELRFTAPVDVVAGQTYVASYLAPTGHFAYDNWAFSASALKASPLTAPRSTATNGNGVFIYGPQRYPNESFKDTSYGVDVLFDNRDTYPPVVSASTPAADAGSVVATIAPTAVLSKAVQPGTVQFTLAVTGGASVSGTMAYDATTRTAKFTPAQALARGTSYTASVSATDLAGNAMPTPYTWKFTTVKPDPVPYVCPCSVWSDSAVPDVVSVNEQAVLDLGARFSTDADGVITGVRFYKGPQNTGLHTGSLWSATGTLLATATFSGESSTGWQTVTFSNPVTVTKGTTYVVSYKTSVGNYSATWGAFANTGVDSGPLHVRRSAGAYAYGGGYPASGSDANYWVDPVFTVPDTMPPTVASVRPSNGATGVDSTPTITATFADLVRPGTAAVTVTGPLGAMPGTTSFDTATATLTWVPSVSLQDGTTYTVSVSGARNLGGTAMSAASTSTFRTAGITACPCTLFSSDATPVRVDSGDGGPVTLGVKFTPSAAGNITGVRFYKSAGNTGTHIGGLWTSTGTRLGTVTFTGETASGWQSATFSQPIDVQAGVTYVATYSAPNGHYSIDLDTYDTAVTSGPLTAPGGANGVHRYGADAFPTDSFSSSSYWVTPVYSPGTAPDVTAPSVTATTPDDGAAKVDAAVTPTATLSESVASGATFTLKNAGGATVAGTTSYDSATKKLSFDPTASLAASTTYTASVSATDLSGNTMATPYTWSFTVFGPQTCPCSVFAATERPSVDSVTDPGGAIELGLAVKPSVDGTVTGVRFWKGAGNTGTHTGSLWTTTGTRLATGTFTGETASGWQTLTFATPVGVTANTTYVVSYTNLTGTWSVTWGQFDSAGLNWPPLSVPVQGGRFLYGAGFPASSSGANYGVDVVFTTDATPPPPPEDPPAGDTTAPVVSAVQDSAGADGSTATITWTTDESATSVVQYGTTAALGSTASGASGTSHSVALSGLTSGTTYYYRVTSADTTGNTTTSPAVSGAPATFATPVITAPDVTPPTVSAVAAAVSGTTATVTWTTDESATTKVDYGPTTSLGTSATGAAGTSHSVPLTGLAAGTYYYRVTSADPAGNSTTDPATASAPLSFVIADTTAPAISAVASTGSGTTATVTWTTDESSTSSVAYGTTTALGTTRTGTSGTSHSVSLTGLTPNTRYYYRVTSADTAGNSATSPASPAAPASYLPTVAPIAHTTVAQFSTGTGGYLSDTNGGEVLSTVTAGSEFTGTTTPTGFTSAALVSGGATTYAGGQASLSGSRLYTATYASGRSFASAATLGANHTIGWGSIAAGSTAITASFQTNATGALSARVNDGGANNATIAIAGTWTGAEHEYRVDWASGTAVFFIDGTQVATSAFSTGLSLRVIASDPTTAAPVLLVDWTRVAPYAAATTFTSAVIDAGATVGWDTLTRDVVLPSGTTMTIQVRSGPNANTGSGAWTGWSTVSTTTNSITRSSRYLQYRLQFTSTGSRFTTPTVNSVQLAYHVL